MSRMQFQYDYMGGSAPQNLGILVCDRCLDDLQYQDMLLILPPDPAPIFNTRPEPYAVDETNWLTTQDSEIILTQNDNLLTPSIPSPDEDANTTYLSAVLAYPGGSIAALYLDLFIGHPASGGYSILSAITGSATRTNFATSFEETATRAYNTVEMSVVSATVANSSVEYIAFYDAASGGTLLVSGPVSATTPTIADGVAVNVAPRGIILNF